MPDLEGLKKAVGGDNVTAEPADIKGFAAADGTPRGAVIAIARPGNTGQLRDLILLARERGLNLVFSSSTPPRYRGDTTPDEDGVIVDLSGMDRILRMDRRNKVAYIEPGVTFPELVEAADREGLKVLMPLLPRRGKSVLASYLEREPITIPKYHWDMTDPLLCTEMVFGSGDLYRTGTAGSPGNLRQQLEVGLAHKNPMGPGAADFVRMVQGSQGTLAGVTWGTVKLEVKPTIHRIHFAAHPDLGRLIDFTYRALRRRLADEWLILGDRALAAVIGEDAFQVEDLAGRQERWTVVFGVSGYRHLPGERVAVQEKELGKAAQASGVRITSEVPGCPARKIEGKLSGPSGDPCYRTVPRGAFRELFFLAPLDRAGGLIELTRGCCEAGGYPPDELGVYIQPVQQGRTAHVELTLYHDPADAAGSERTAAVIEKAGPELDAAGAFFSRPYGAWSRFAYRDCPDTVEALKKVKRIMDPDNVLNRGKLCFGEEVV